MSRFEDYLKNADLIFEDYEKWFQNLKVGDFVRRNSYCPDDLTKIEKVAESPTGNGVKFVSRYSSGVSLFYRLNSAAKTLFLEHSEDETRIINNPESFPVPDEKELSEIKQKRGRVAEKEIKANPLLAIGQEWQTRKRGKATIFSCSGDKFFAWIEDDSIFTAYFHNRAKVYHNENYDLIEYLGETNRPRLKIGEEYFREDGTLIYINKQRLGEICVFEDSDGVTYGEFGFKTTNPIVRSKTKEEKAQVRKPAPIYIMPLVEETENQEEKAMSGQTVLKQEEIPNKEYPAIEIKDLCPGDLIEDPFGNLFVYGDGVLYDKNGIITSLKREIKYRLVQKRKYVRPLDVMFVYKGENKEEIRSSYAQGRKWFSTCAELEKEPEIVERRLMIPAFVNKIASFQNASDAFNFINSQGEPQLYALILGNDQSYWVTKDFIRTERKLPINNSSDEVKEQLKAKVEDLKTDLAARDQEIKLFEKHVDQLNAKHESEIQGARQSLKATREKYEESLKACKESFETLRTTTSVIQNGRDDLLRQRDEDTQKIGFLNRQIERMTSEKNKLNEDIISLLGTQEMLRGELHKRVDHIEFLMKELTKEQEESKKARQKLQELSVALEKC